MTNTEKILGEFEKELSKLVIDLVWSATDGGCKITESNFSHFGEPIPEWTALVSKFSSSIHQALAEERENVRGEIRKRRDGFSISTTFAVMMMSQRGDAGKMAKGLRELGGYQALDDLNTFLSSLDKPLTDKETNL